jgi:hypothetical protein
VDFGSGFTAGAYYKGTDADEFFYTYKGKDWSDNRAVAFVAWTSRAAHTGEET